ncbi:hypothetical protein BGX26_011317 [Mortierella sp. AD094]|nr:hypothetical protein BGX26_011317 [Mortierella sp. AD094]
MSDHPTEVDRGFVKLHFMDLHPSWDTDLINDLRVHQLYIWSIDVGRFHKTASEPTRGQPKKIIHYAISEDESHAATLAAMKSHLLVELWDLRAPGGLNAHSNSTTTMEPYRPRLSAGLEVPFEDALNYDFNSFQVSVSSVSWDSLQVALIDSSKHYRQSGGESKSTFAIYTYAKAHSQSMPTPNPNYTELVPHQGYKQVRELRDYYGYGKFHHTDTLDPHAGNECFIASDGATVDVYDVSRSWWQYRCRISIAFPRVGEILGLTSARNLIDTLRGRYFTWNNQPEYPEVVSVWDLGTGRMKSWHWKEGYNSRSSLNGGITLSHSGDIMAFGVKNQITFYYTETGCQFGSLKIPGYYQVVLDITFTQDDSQLLIILNGSNDENIPDQEGLIVDVASLTMIGRFIVNNLSKSKQSQRTLKDNILCVSGSSLDLVKLEDSLIQTFSIPKQVCTDRCKSELVPLKLEPGWTPTMSGLQFEVKTSSAGKPGVVVSARSSDGHAGSVFTIPSFSGLGRFGRGYLCAAIPGRYSRLMVASDSFITLWGLPITLDGEYDLLLAWKAQSDVFWDQGSDYWYSCPHGQIYAVENYQDDNGNQDKVFFCPRVERVFCDEESQLFLDALEILASMYVRGDTALRDGILRYVGSHINNYPNPKDRSESVIAHLCKTWSPAVHDIYEVFLKALLRSPTGQWIPLLSPTDDDRSSNPLHLIMEHAVKRPRALSIAEVLVDYCIEMLWQHTSNSEYELPRYVEMYFAILYFVFEPLSTVLRKLTRVVVLSENMMERHRFPIDAYDHPSIAAIIEFKWITSGRQHWITRFFYHCALYVILLITVFLQIYSDSYQLNVYQPIFDVFTLLGSTALLALEVVNFLKEGKLLPSLYNFVGLVTFGLILGGSINQTLLDSGQSSVGNRRIGLLSFSILFVFLNIAGRFDPVSGDFDSDNWAFHTMMIIFLFFTIILINVLIALINDAYNYIKNHPELFPKEIYYSATPAQFKEYKEKYFADRKAGGDADLTDGSQDLYDDLSPENKSDTEANNEAVLVVQQEITTQLESIQRQQKQQEEQMTRLESKMSSIPTQDTLPTSREQFEEYKNLIQEEMNRRFEEQLSKQQESHEKQMAKLQDLVSILLAQVNQPTQN